MNGRKRIVILGGGCGGVVAATRLGRLLGADHDVVLIDRRAEHIFMPAFLFLMIGRRTPSDISRSLSHLGKRNVKLIRSEIVGIDPVRQEVVLQNEKVGYDHLIVSLGLQTRPDLVPGFAEASLHPWEMESALKLRDALASFRGGRIVVGVPLGPYRCPPAPYETQWLIDEYFRQRGIRERVQIEYFTREPEPTGEAHDPVVWMDAESKRRGIKQNYEFVVHSIDPRKKVVYGLYGYSLPYDLLVMVPPHRPAQVLLDSGLAETENGIRVDYDTLRTKWENVYAIGDCADMPASKAGGVAHQEADVLAHNLAVEITGKGRPVDLWLHTI
ncbi:MAG TPA: FAD/NAD(P)-binding oxidoreductase [candidate division Zixibacteria bacterium]|nr:FAD/NAD(P)-binding oxidoreductase [candidate division Zixibacteria bacterium]